MSSPITIGPVENRAIELKKEKRFYYLLEMFPIPHSVFYLCHSFLLFICTCRHTSKGSAHWFSDFEELIKIPHPNHTHKKWHLKESLISVHRARFGRISMRFMLNKKFLLKFPLLVYSLTCTVARSTFLVYLIAVALPSSAFHKLFQLIFS